MEYVTAILAQIKEKPFIFASIFIHIILISIFYTQMPDSLLSTEKTISDYGQQALREKEKAKIELAKNYGDRASQAEMKANVKDMREIKHVMEEIAKAEGQDQTFDNQLPSQEKVALLPELNAAQEILLNNLLALEQESLQLKTQIQFIAESLKTDQQRAIEAQSRKNDEVKKVDSLVVEKTENLTVDSLRSRVKNNHGEAQQSLAEFHQLVKSKNQGNSIYITNDDVNEVGSYSLTPLFGKNIDSYSMAAESESLPSGINTQPNFLVASKNIGKEGYKADRVFLDTWYMIGPFDNSTLHSKEFVHPPENQIDLDAIYQGKNEKLIKWEYYQSINYPVVPKNANGNATYYGFSEINFDEATSIWVGLGCDDDCKVWINNEMIWKSGKQRKRWFNDGGFKFLSQDVANWDLHESYRKINFNKGLNSVLFRLDNNSYDVFMSVVLFRKN